MRRELSSSGSRLPPSCPLTRFLNPVLEARRRYGVTPEEADATVNSSPDVDGAFDQTGSFEFEPEPEPEAGPSSWPRSPTTPSGQNAVVPIPQWAHLSSTATENLLADLVGRSAQPFALWSDLNLRWLFQTYTFSHLTFK